MIISSSYNHRSALIQGGGGVTRIVVIAAVVISHVRPGRGGRRATAHLQSELLKDWMELRPVMMAIASAMPEEKFTYKSTPAQRDYGQQIMHVATGNMAYLRFFGGKATAPAFDRNARSKAEILQASPPRSISATP
jgi:hypothetical protein